MVNCSMTASTNRVLPEGIGALTAVYAEADWMKFNREKWETNLPEETFVKKEKDDQFVCNSRNLRLSGTTLNLPQEGRPSGVQIEPGSAIGRGMRPGFINAFPGGK